MTTNPPASPTISIPCRLGTCSGRMVLMKASKLAEAFQCARCGMWAYIPKAMSERIRREKP